MDYQLDGSFGVSNVVIPKGGPKAVPAKLDFSNAAVIEIEGQQIIDEGQIEYLQGVFIDNADNPFPLSLEMSGTQQRIVAAPNTQGYYAIMLPNPPRLTAKTTQNSGLNVSLTFYNVPIQSIVWSAN